MAWFIIERMNSKKAAAQLAELGYITRLEIYRLLVKSGEKGLPVSIIQETLDVPGSTLSHHITRLMRVGLIKQEREGRVLRCHAQYNQLEKLIGFLLEECCSQPNCCE